MILYREIEEPLPTTNSAAYRMMDLINQVSHTDDPEVIAMFEDAILDGEYEFKAYVKDCLNAASDLMLSVDAIDAEIKRLRELKDMRKSRAERLQNGVKRYMGGMGLSEILTDLFTVKLRKNPPSVIIDDEMIIDKEYITETVKVSTAPNKKMIAEALKAGIPVTGAHLDQSVRIEIK